MNKLEKSVERGFVKGAIMGIVVYALFSIVSNIWDNYQKRFSPQEEKIIKPSTEDRYTVFPCGTYNTV
jgi:hypothetical protein